LKEKRIALPDRAPDALLADKVMMPTLSAPISQVST
jgi:hypothetical protein